MASIKCKMCGAGIQMEKDKTHGICEYCGCIVTYPKISDEERIAAYDRGNFFRRKGEFDKALLIYEKMIQENPKDAEAHWCCVLCRYGIEYVQDEDGMDWVPTCHRASFDSILEDIDYQYALEYSDGVTRRQYQKEAIRISEIQKRILRTSQNEEKYDIFICYKEQDERGERTQDSVLAQNIYDQLDKAGYRTFFARITLEDKVGTEYEPYIFAALHSARIMIVIGTKKEYLDAVWVKNEWSRYLALMHKDSTKIILPCYQQMSPYDMPEALSMVQSYDMEKIGFMQDLLHGIGRIMHTEEEKKEIAAHHETVVIQGNAPNLNALLKRGDLALEDKEWDKADHFFEEVLNNDPENSHAYFGKFYASKRSSDLEEILQKENEKHEEYTCGKEKLSIDIEESVKRLIETSSLKIDAERNWILQQLQDIDVWYFSDRKKAQMDLKSLERLQKEDGNLSKAVRFKNVDDKLYMEFMTIVKKLHATQEKTVKEAEKAQNIVKEQYAVRYKEIQQEAECRKICSECRVPPNMFADNEKTATMVKREKQQIQKIYQDVDLETMDDLCQKLRSMDLTVYDKDAEVHNVENIMRQYSELKSKEKKSREDAERYLQEYQEKKEKLIIRQRGLKSKIKDAQFIRETYDDKWQMVQNGIFLGAIGIWAFAALLVYAGFAGMGGMAVLGGVACGALGYVPFWISRIVKFKRENIVSDEVYQELQEIKELLDEVEQKIHVAQYEHETETMKYQQQIERVEIPTACLKFKTNHVVLAQAVIPMKLKYIDKMHLYFETQNMDKEIGVSVKDAQIFCYEKAQFYPIAINDCKKQDRGYLLDIAVRELGLLVKLENFTNEQHYMLLGDF